MAVKALLKEDATFSIMFDHNHAIRITKCWAETTGDKALGNLNYEEIKVMIKYRS